MITEGTTSKVCNDDQWRGRRKKREKETEAFFGANRDRANDLGFFFLFFPFFFAGGKRERERRGKNKRTTERERGEKGGHPVIAGEGVKQREKVHYKAVRLTRPIRFLTRPTSPSQQRKRGCVCACRWKMEDRRRRRKSE